MCFSFHLTLLHTLLLTLGLWVFHTSSNSLQSHLSALHSTLSLSPGGSLRSHKLGPQSHETAPTADTSPKSQAVTHLYNDNESELMIKGIREDTDSQMKRCLERECGKGYGAARSSPGAPLSQHPTRHQPRSTLNAYTTEIFKRPHH